MQKLDLLSVPLTGVQLIEASAGTGKTFTIANVVIRLLLEQRQVGLSDNQPKASHVDSGVLKVGTRENVGTREKTGTREPLSIEQILIVTFTRAATEELRARVRKNIRQALDCLEGRLEVQAPLSDILQQHLHGDQQRLAIRRLRDALIMMDEAAIFTIHGFCQRVIETTAFESGSFFEAEYVTDQRELELEVYIQYWRDKNSANRHHSNHP